MSGGALPCLLLALALPDAAAVEGAAPATAMDGGGADEVGADTGTEAPAGDAGQAAAPGGRLAGQVRSRGSRGLVPGARVSAAPTGATKVVVEADDDGRFSLPLPCGPVEVAVRAPGYEPLSFAADACADPADHVLRLSPRPDLPVYEAVVLAPHDEPRVELRGPELTTTPGSLGDPFRTIESLPGVAAVAWPAPIYAIRGSNPGNTGYVLDDLQVPLLFHLLLGPAVVHPGLFAGLELYPGGYPARYGRYVGGLVTAQTRSPPEDRVRGTVDARLFDAGVLVSSPFPDRNGGAAAAFRYSYTGALLSLLRNDVALSYWDYQVRVGRRVRGWQLTLLVLGSGDDLRYHPSVFVAGGSGTDSDNLNDRYQDQQYALRFHRASLRASRPLGGGQLTLQLAVGSDTATAPLFRVLPVTLSSASLLPRLSYQRVAGGIDWQTGIDAQLQWFRPRSTVEEGGNWDLARDRTAVLVAGYLAAGVRIRERLSVTPALRLDSYTIGGVTKLDLGPRVSARLQLDDESWLSVSGARVSQPPSLPVQVPAAESFGLALYGLQTAWQGALGGGTRRLLGVELEVTGFLQRYVLTDLRDPTLVEPDPLASDFIVRRDARSYGIELLIRRPASHRLHGWLSYTLSKSERALGGGVIGPSDWDQRHILNLVVGYRLGRYALGARGHLHSGQPMLVHGQTADAFVRLPAFYQLDLRVERHFLFDAFSLHVYAEVVNTTMTRQVYGLGQDEATGALEQYSLRLLLPSVGLRAEL